MKVSELRAILSSMPDDATVVVWDGYSASCKEVESASVYAVRGVSDPSQSEYDLKRPVVALVRHPLRGFGIYPRDVYGNKP